MTGRPWVTELDGAVLRWLGEQYGARVDVVGVLLARYGPGGTSVSRRTVRGAVGRWERAGLARVVHLAGRTWIVPTRDGLDVAGLGEDGLGFAGWSPKLSRLEHVHAVGLVRLAIEPAMSGGGRWVSERELRREEIAFHGSRRPGERRELGHLADAAIEVPGEPKRHAVEVELTRKDHWRLSRIVGELRLSRYARAVWFAAPDIAKPLRTQLAQLAADKAREMHVEVQPLPEPPAGLSYGAVS